MWTLTLEDPQATHAAGIALARCLEPGDVVLLTGELGAGKTALTKGVAEGLGVAGPVTSPTFNILLVYPGRLTLNHIDLYRLERSEELVDIDYWGTLEADGVSVVEWGDRFPDAMPAHYALARIGMLDDTRRSIEVRGVGPRGEQLAEKWISALYGLAGVTRGGDLP